MTLLISIIQIVSLKRNLVFLSHVVVQYYFRRFFIRQRIEKVVIMQMQQQIKLGNKSNTFGGIHP